MCAGWLTQSNSPTTNLQTWTHSFSYLRATISEPVVVGRNITRACRFNRLYWLRLVVHRIGKLIRSRCQLGKDLLQRRSRTGIRIKACFCSALHFTLLGIDWSAFSSLTHQWFSFAFPIISHRLRSPRIWHSWAPISPTCLQIMKEGSVLVNSLATINTRVSPKKWDLFVP